MKKIILNNQLLGIVDKPRWVKKNPTTGIWIQCNEENAEAIAVQGLLYNLPGSTLVPDCDSVEIEECNMSEFIFNNINTTEQLEAKVDYLMMMTELDGSLDEEPEMPEEEEEEQQEEEPEPNPEPIILIDPSEEENSENSEEEEETEQEGEEQDVDEI